MVRFLQIKFFTCSYQNDLGVPPKTLVKNIKGRKDIMANRYRNERIEIKLTKEEKEIFKKKLELSKLKSMGHFIRKCVLEAPIFVIDMNEFRKIQTFIGRNANNLNQIAKRVNTTGVIYREDIEDLKKENDDISREMIKIQNILARKYI
ncbi:plasmid mobilization protein [Tissierella pigra]|nr:plasmid mobilization relaxosome protein MobC [Tissierella pigra]